MTTLLMPRPELSRKDAATTQISPLVRVDGRSGGHGKGEEDGQAEAGRRKQLTLTLKEGLVEGGPRV